MPVTAEAQNPAQDTYLQAVAEHYRVSVDEVKVLASWGLPVAEIPVVLFIAGRGGVSPDAVIALRRSGRSWSELSGRYQLHAGQYHVPIGDTVDAAPLVRAYGEFRSRPGASWAAIELADEEIVGLVHLRFFTEYLNLPAAQVLGALARAGVGPPALQALRRGA